MTTHSIAEKLYSYSEKLEKGTLSGDEILMLTDLSREFYERMIVLRFKTVEESVENTPEPEVEEVATEPVLQTPVEPILEEEPDVSEEIKEKTEALVAQHSEEIEKEPEVLLAQSSEEIIEETPTERPKEESINTDSVELPEPEINAAPPEKSEVQEEPVSTYGPTVSPNQISLIDSIEEIKQMEQSLNETFKHENPTLAQKLHRKPITDLKSAVTINQKFQFISHLFAKDADAFNVAIDRLNGCATYLEADEYIQNTLIDTYDWDMKSPPAKEIMDLIERKFL